jgi:hypothetical protein
MAVFLDVSYIGGGHRITSAAKKITHREDTSGAQYVPLELD